MQRAADDTTHECKHQLVALRLAVHPRQALYDDIEAGLLGRLAYHRFVWHFAGFDSSTRQVPSIQIDPMRQQHPSVLVNDDGEGTNGDHSASDANSAARRT